MINGSPTNLDTLQIDYLYDEEGAPYGGVYRSSTLGAPLFFAVVTNARHDVVELLDAKGEAFAAYRYDPWGLPLGDGNHATGIWTDANGTSLVDATTAGQIADRQVLRYAGYVFDSETGLYYCSSRYYDPASRQWITGDPDGSDGEASPYQYCSGNPVALTDPSGCTATLHNVHNSLNWCGYVLRDTHIKGVDGHFKAQAANGNSKMKAHTAQWVGLGGYGNKRLLQAGTFMDTHWLHPWSFSWTHNAVWEETQGDNDTGPKQTFKVNLGDYMVVYMREEGSNSYSMCLADTTNGKTWNNKNKTLTFKPPDNSNLQNRRSAEWIVEKYDTGNDQSTYVFGNLQAAFMNCRWYDGTGYLRMNYGSGDIYRVTFIGDDNPNTTKHEHWVTPSKIGKDDQSFSIKSSSY
jgi:RHS repeat-associated protein